MPGVKGISLGQNRNTSSGINGGLVFFSMISFQLIFLKKTCFFIAFAESSSCPRRLEGIFFRSF